MPRYVAVIIAVAVTIGATLGFPRNVRAQDDDDEETARTGFFIDVAYGWATVRGNDVHVGDKTTISRRGVFDDSTFEPLVTRMSSEWMPYVRSGYRGELWGVEGEFWQIDTGGQLDGSFEQSVRRSRREMVRFWDWWHGEDNDEVSYAAGNDLSLWSARIDLTRSLTPQLSLAVGPHVAELENERVEQVSVADQLFFADQFLFDSPTFERERSARARVEGLLLGPSIGFRGFASLGNSARVGYSFAQSVLFAEVDHDADFAFKFFEPFAPPDITANTWRSVRVAVPVSDLRLSLSFDVGDRVSIGALDLVSVWYNVPTAPEFSAALEEWEQVDRTLVFGSVGPVVTIRF